MIKSTHCEHYVRFMGFRDCPACGEMLFAAEHAEFVCAGCVTLHWRCNSCDHMFSTNATFETRRRVPLNDAVTVGLAALPTAGE